MAEDVIVRGDLVEFRNSQRCEACQARGRDCIIRVGAETCLLCSDTARPCIFERSVRLRGPATRFNWDLILARKDVVDLGDDFGAASPQHSANYISASSFRASNETTLFRRHTQALSNHGQIPKTHGEPKGLRLWRRVFTLLRAASAFRTPVGGLSSHKSSHSIICPILHCPQAGSRFESQADLKKHTQEYHLQPADCHKWPDFTTTTEEGGSSRDAPPFQIFDTQMMKPVRRQRRRLSEGQKKIANAVRKDGACDFCRDAHRKCRHNLSGVDDYSGPVNPNPKGEELAFVDPNDDADIVPYSPSQDSFQENSADALLKLAARPEIRSSKRSMIPHTIPEAAYARPQQKKIRCPQCSDHPGGFRGEHELRRHIERAHSTVRKGWVCIDASKDGRLLADCRACQNEKTYGAYYNAAAHLRRVHFNPPQKRKGRAKADLDEPRGGHDGGQYPAMDVLKKFMKEVEVEPDDDITSQRGANEQETYPTTDGPSSSNFDVSLYPFEEQRSELLVLDSTPTNSASEVPRLSTYTNNKFPSAPRDLGGPDKVPLGMDSEMSFVG